MNKSKAKLIVFTAPSGSGKTTIARRILNDYQNFEFSVSATTRERRENEVHGKDYYFISEEDFQNKIENDEFIEWEKFYDYHYGTLKSVVEEKLKNGISVIFDIDVKGAVNIKKYYPEDSVVIFVMPPSLEELKKRLTERKTESDEDFKKRIDRAEMELTYNDKFDYKVINEVLDDAVVQVKEIIDNNIN
ncbi:MAG: guanylate kinase [Rhodothermaceae bacterium]